MAPTRPQNTRRYAKHLQKCTYDKSDRWMAPVFFSSFLPRPKLISGQLDMEDLDIDMSMTAEELTEAAAG